MSTYEFLKYYFDETILGLLDIATQAGSVFDKSNNNELKRLLLKFVFESLTLTEGKLTYKLRFSFNKFADNKILPAQVSKTDEPTQSQVNQCVQGNDNGNLQLGAIKSLKPQISDKKTRS